MCFQKPAYWENKNIQGKNEKEKQQQNSFFRKSYYKKYFLTYMKVNIICFHTLQQKKKPCKERRIVVIVSELHF